MLHNWMRREDSTLPDGYGVKAGEDLTQEKTLALGLQQRVHSGHGGEACSSQRQEGESCSTQVSGVKGRVQGRECAGVKKLGSEPMGA